jgi:hypothetical protein
MAEMAEFADVMAMDRIACFRTGRTRAGGASMPKPARGGGTMVAAPFDQGSFRNGDENEERVSG